jgi:hypothetical protein
VRALSWALLSAVETSIPQGTQKRGRIQPLNQTTNDGFFFSIDWLWNTYLPLNLEGPFLRLAIFPQTTHRP